MMKDGNSNIYLIGFMGTGKSTIAYSLNEMIDKEVIEMDDLIVEEQNMPITDIFKKRGEEYFRDLETDLLKRVQTEGNKIVSCGGGVVINPQNVDIMKQSGIIVCLTANPETIFHRVKNSTKRPILNNNMSVKFIKELMEKRREKYLEAADIVIATDNKTINQIRSEIIRKCRI